MKKTKNDDELEILTSIDEEEKEVNKVSKKTKRKMKKKGKRIVFCLLSFLFMLGCFVYYGRRLVKYYRQFNPKSDGNNSIVLLANAILKKTSIVYKGSGLYLYSGNYIYKGKDAKNYVIYNNMLWRIVKINTDKTIELVSDNNINILDYDSKTSSYISSDLNKYLNDVFLSKLDTTKLTKSIICTDSVKDLTKITCNNTNTNYDVKLLDVTSYLNSKADSETYITALSNVWLDSDNGKNVWSINGDNLSLIAPNSSYLVKPVITLARNNTLLSGNGSKEKPYIIDKHDKVTVGSYLKLNNDTWIVYDIKDNTWSLELEDLEQNNLSLYRFDTVSNIYNPASSTSLAYYLNNTFYNSLDYKDLLLDSTWYIGPYNTSYKDIYTKQVSAKVGILNINDLKFGDNIQNYYISTPATPNHAYIYSTDLLESKITLSRVPRPTINIKNLKIKSGTGLKDSPYIMEVK